MIEKSKTNKLGLRVRVRLSFTQHQNHRKVLEYLQMKIGEGKVADYEHNKMSEYVIRDQDVINDILIKIQLYLIVKLPHLKIALKILNLKNRNSNLRDLKKSYKLVQEIKSLNNYPKKSNLTP